MFHLILLTSIVLFYIGNSSKISEEDLIGGERVATAEYKDGKASGDPDRLDFLIEGLEFKRDGVVYGKKLDDEFDYELEEGTEIKFTRKDRSHVYYIVSIVKLSETKYLYQHLP